MTHSITYRFCFFLLFTAPFLVRAQEVVNDYEMAYFEKTYEISASKEKGNITYYVTMCSLEGERNLVVLMIENAEKMETFKKGVRSAKQTYMKWDSVSVANSVTDLDKRMSISTYGLKSGFVYGSEWRFDFSTSLTYQFKHVDGAPRLIIRTGELQHEQNEYMESKGGVFVFSSIEEIDAFLEALNPSYAINFFSKKESMESLFED